METHQVLGYLESASRLQLESSFPSHPDLIYIPSETLCTGLQMLNNTRVCFFPIYLFLDSDKKSDIYL